MYFKNQRIILGVVALVATYGALPGSYAAELSKEDAINESHKIHCYQNFVPINIVQKLDENTFFGYTRFSVGRAEPLLLVYAINQKPLGSGMTMLYPTYGLSYSGDREMRLDSGFSQKVSVLKVGDKRCAELWAVIGK